MNANELNERLVAVGAKIKAKGWESASIDIFVSYLAIFDREAGPRDPMISCRPSIRASTRDRYKSPTTHEFVRDAWDCKTMDQAVEKLEAAADAMPKADEEAARIENAKSKLSDEEKRLLGVR
jgi:hypothetical protein